MDQGGGLNGLAPRKIHESWWKRLAPLPSVKFFPLPFYTRQPVSESLEKD